MMYTRTFREGAQRASQLNQVFLKKGAQLAGLDYNNVMVSHKKLMDNA